MSFRLGTIGPTAQASRVHMDTKPTCGALKTPHRGQLRDSLAQETTDQGTVGCIAGAGHEANTAEIQDIKSSVGHMGSFIELEFERQGKMNACSDLICTVKKMSLFPVSDLISPWSSDFPQLSGWAGWMPRWCPFRTGESSVQINQSH